jgi:CheY-like chemotaxis protein
MAVAPRHGWAGLGCSQRPGGGTRAGISWADGRDEHHQHQIRTDGAPEAHRRGRKHIFAVNGSPIFLDAIRVLFQEEAYNVTTTNFVAETFAPDRVGRSGLIVLDLTIYQQAGWDLLERLHADDRTSDTPVVVVSTDKALSEGSAGES